MVASFLANFITHILFKSFQNITVKTFQSPIKKGTQDLRDSAFLISGSFHNFLKSQVRHTFCSLLRFRLLLGLRFRLRLGLRFHLLLGLPFRLLHQNN